jgi:peptidoglycan/LPS O-acetylase OafA/YrhL
MDVVEHALARATSTTLDPAAQRHRRDVQGLRGLAVLLVVAFHAKVIAGGGYVGVDVFFVISGFVITASLLREIDEHQRVSFRAFYTRRVKRLLPLLGFVLVVVAALSALTLSAFGPQITAAKTGLAASLFSSNLSLYLSPSGYFGAPSAVNPFLHMWSLSVEEQFYIAYPLVFVGAYRLTDRSAQPRARLRLTVLLGAFAAVSLALCIGITSLAPGTWGISEPGRLAFYAPVTRAWEFLAGAVLATAPALPWLRRRYVGSWAMPLGLALVAFAALRYSEFTTFPGVAAVVPVLGTMLLIAGGSGGQSSAGSRLLSSRLLVWLGDISYGWYLWHWPLIVAARMVWPGAGWGPAAAAVFALVPTVVSYRTFETSLRFSPRLTGRRVIALAAGCVVAPVIAFTGLRWGAQHQWHIASIQNAQAQLGLHADELRGCSTVAALDLSSCRWPAEGASAGSVVLVGDSNAGHFTEAMVGAATELHLDLTVSTSSGCPFVALTMSRPGLGFDTACADRVARTMQRLIEMQPDVVVIASATDIDFAASDALRLADGSATVTDKAAKPALWADALSTTVNELTSHGIRVLVVHPVPRFPAFDPPTRCTTAEAIVDVAGCGSTRPRDEALGDLASAISAENSAVSSIGRRAATLDLSSELCPGDPCRTNSANTWIFRDWAHISVGASERLTPAFTDAVGRLLG